MNPRAFVAIFTLFIIIVVGYVGFISFQEKFGLNKDLAIAYFLKGEGLAPVKQGLESGQDAVNESFAILLMGPTKELKAKGYYTALPANLIIVNAERKGSTLVLELNNLFLAISGGTFNTEAAVAQLVYTATEQKGINKVELKVFGKEGPLVLGGEGYVIDKPLSRRDVNLK